MKSSFKGFVLTLIAISAFAHSVSVEKLQQTKNQILVQSVNQTVNTEARVPDSGMLRDLRNGNFALTCQTEDGSYIPNLNNYIYSPVISIPEGSLVQFDLWLKGDFSDSNQGDDFWGCQIQVGGTGNWFYISNPYGSPTGDNYIYVDAPVEWSSFVDNYSLDGLLNDYAGMDVQFRLYFVSDADTPIGGGISFDDLSITVDGVQRYFEDFEDGNLDGWVSEDATATPAMWHTSAVGAYGGTGQSWAMNDPAVGNTGGYLDDWYQVLDSPPVTLPTGQVNVISFQQNRSIEDIGSSEDFPEYNGWDGTNVRISADDGATWEVLTDVSPAFNSTSMFSFGYSHDEGANIPGWGGSSGGWQAVAITIPSTYDNLEVKFRFAFASDGAFDTGTAPPYGNPAMFGWLIDDIDIAGVLTNDGESTTGWIASSNVPIAGDLWHVAFSGSLPIPSSVTTEAGDSQVNVTWAPPISGDVSEIAHDNPAAWRYFLNDTQPYGVMFEATEDNSFLGAMKFYMLSLSGAFSGTAEASVYSVGADNLPDELIFTMEDVVVQDYPSATTVDLSGTGLSFNAGEKFAFCVGNFSGGASEDQGLLADSISAANPATGNSVVWSGSAWLDITEAYNDISNLAIRAEVIIPDPEFSPESYNVYRRLSTSSFGSALVSNIDAISYLDTDASNGETYYYAVSANYPNGESDLSLEAMAEPESQTVVEIAYDDGTVEFGMNIGSGNYQAVKFTPNGYPTLLKRVKAYVHDDEPAPFLAYVWDDDGASGLPLTQLGLHGWTFPETGWNVWDFTADSIWITSGSIYFGIKELPGSPSMGADTDGGYSGNSYYALVDGDGNINWANMSSLGLEYNLMYRIDVDTAFVVVGIDESKQANLPSNYSLEQNYPNPFNPSTEISYSLPESGNVELKIFDLSGREVDVLVQEYQDAGLYRLRIDGSHMSSGIYIYTLTTGNVHLTRKMILLK